MDSGCPTPPARVEGRIMKVEGRKLKMRNVRAGGCGRGRLVGSGVRRGREGCRGRVVRPLPEPYLQVMENHWSHSSAVESQRKARPHPFPMASQARHESVARVGTLSDITLALTPPSP